MDFKEFTIMNKCNCQVNYNTKIVIVWKKPHWNTYNYECSSNINVYKWTLFYYKRRQRTGKYISSKYVYNGNNLQCKV